MTEFIISKDTGQTKSIVKTPNLGKVNFELLKALMNRTFYKTTFRGKGAEETSQTLKDISLNAQELSVHMWKKSGKEGRRLAWMSKDLLVKLKLKTEMHRQ